jgi:lipopolysaccharide assembly protein A
MIRYLRYLSLAVVAVLLLTVALANRTPVIVRLLPEDMGLFSGVTWSMQLPLFLVIFGGIVAGLLIGFVWEWARETKHRSTASTKSREVARLEREVNRLRDAKAEPEDEILALLAKPRKTG